MNTRADMLARRRERLLALSAAQRADLVVQAQSLNQSAVRVGTGLRILDRIRRHPEWIVAAMLGLAAVTPRRLSSMMRFGVSGLRMWRTVGPIVMSMLARHGGHAS